MNSQPLKILHITYDMRIGGTEMVIKNIIEGSDKTRFSMSIYCIEEAIGPWGSAMKEAGIELASTQRKSGFDLSLISRLKSFIKQRRIDIVHCHQYTPWVYGALACFGLPAKVVFTEHGRFYPDSSSPKRRIVNPILSALTYKITAISAATKQALIDYEFLAKDRIRVIYNGIRALEVSDSEPNLLKAKLNIHDDDIVFGTIARLDPIKNHTMMLEAFADASNGRDDMKLVIVGDGELMDDLQKRAHQLSIQERVIFTGYIPYPKDYLAIFDVFLLSSLSEGTSMTLLEAMSLGKPCVVTDAGGNNEIVEHEKTGLVTENNNMKQFSNAMGIMYENKAIRDDYSIKALRRFSENFSESIMCEQYAQLYECKYDR